MQANPDAFTPDLAMSLNNQANRLADVGRREEALDAITEAVTLRRRLVQTNPAAYLPNLAGSLNNLALRLAEVGCREEALDAVTESVTLRRPLAEANPAAFTRDLAESLNNQANILADVGRRDEALDVWDAAIENLAERPGFKVELICERARWLAAHGHPELAAADLRAMGATDIEEPSELAALGRARRNAWPVAAVLSESLQGSLPSWAVASLSKGRIELVDAWAAVAHTRQEAAFLRASGDRLQTLEAEGTLDTLRALYPEEPFCAHALVILDQIAEHGLEEAAIAVEATNDRLVTLREWLAIPASAAASRALLEARADVLLDAETEALLEHEQDVDGDPAMDQYLAILRLCRDLPIPDVYDIVIDVSEAADRASDAIERGDSTRLVWVLAASPALERDPFLGTAAVAVLSLLASHTDRAAEVLSHAVPRGSDTARRALTARLTRLATTQPRHAAGAARLCALLIAPSDPK